MKQLLTGNEAVALGALEAGVRFASAYPGTPSTEILENIAAFDKKDIVAEWAVNEKVALEAAIGFSIAGGRALASMKQVGLNVAADPLFSFAYTGGTGGLVIITADEPGLHSSQTEQDNRYYAAMAKIPMLEPADSQEAKDMVIHGIELSEELRVPVLLRMTTRVCHSKSLVEPGARRTPPPVDYGVRDMWQFTTIPAVSAKLRLKLEEKLKTLRERSEISPFNYIEWHDKKIGVITSGISWQYVREVFGDRASYLKLGFTFPTPLDLIKKFAAEVDELYVVEEIEPFLEDQIRAAGIKIHGKDLLPNIGELGPNVIEEKILREKTTIIEIDESKLVPRPPVLCAGCPHRGIFYLLGRRKDLFIAGDIGCYGLGAMAPLSAMDTCLCMGASVSGGHGAARAGEIYDLPRRVVSVIGDSTFFHSGMTGLLNVIYNNSPVVTVILDNRVTGMTGHQEHPGTGLTAQGEPAAEADIPAIVKALGIRELSVVNPLKLDETKAALNRALNLDGPSVIICRWPCALKKMSAADRAEFPPAPGKYYIDADACVGCGKCSATGCPALSLNRQEKKSAIDSAMCLGCSICAQICPKAAIKLEGGAQ